MKTVLLTGSRGFVGGHLFKKLLERNDIETLVHLAGQDWHEGYHRENIGEKKIVRLSGNINSFPILDTLSQYEFDTVFHLAGLATSSSKPVEIFHANTEGAFNLLNTLKGCSRFILSSSSAVYGDGNIHRRSTEHDICRPTSVYGASKLAAANFLHAYSRLKKIDGISLRPCAIVGKGATHGLLPDLIRKIKDPSTTTIELFGDEPGSVKPFIHVDDVVNGFLYFATEMRQWNGIMNLSTTHELSVKEVAELVMSTLENIYTTEDLPNYKFRKKIKWLGDSVLAPGDNKEVSLSNYFLLSSGFQFIQDDSSVTAVVKAIKDIEGVSSEA